MIIPTTLQQNEYALIIFIMLLIIIALTLYAISLKKRMSLFNTFAGGVERMSDFLLHKELIEEYQEYSLDKFGGKCEEYYGKQKIEISPVPPRSKRQDPTPPPPKKEY